MIGFPSSLQLIIFLIHVAALNSFQAFSLRETTRSNPWRTSTFLASSTRRNSVFTQVISDVDDTLKSSGGVNVAGVALGGIDVQYERGDFYPGVAEFMLEISRHGLSDTDAMSPPKVAVLTARAEEFKVALEIKENSKLAVAMRTAGERAGVSGWGVGPVLYGSVAEWIVQFRKGLRKFTNFERLLQQDPTGMIVQVRINPSICSFVCFSKPTYNLFAFICFHSMFMSVIPENWTKKLEKQCCESILKSSRPFFYMWFLTN
jgi:hypothetical protein